MSLISTILKRSKPVEDDEITLIDGKITCVLPPVDETVSQETVILPEPTTETVQPCVNEQTDEAACDLTHVTDLTSHNPSPIPSFPLEPSECSGSENTSACYLLDGDSQDALPAFVTHLKTSSRSARTQYQYTRYLQIIKQHLSDLTRSPDFPGELTAPHLSSMFQQYSPAQAAVMRSALHTYATYRALSNDTRLLRLVESQHIYDPPLPRQRQPNDTLSTDEIPLIQELARELIAQRQRAGIWIMLCLHGVKPHEIRQLNVTSRVTMRVIRRGKEQIITPVPTWLTRAMEHITGWRVNRRIIHAGLQPYQITPHALNAYARQQTIAAQAQKKALERKVKKTVKQQKKQKQQEGEQQHG